MFEPSLYPAPTRSGGRLRGFLGISLLLHANIAALIITLLSINPGGCIPPLATRAVNPFEVSLVPDTEARTLAGKSAIEREREEAIKKEQKKEEEKEKELKGQVVDIPPPAEERQPDKARFLAEHDSKVAKETKGPQVPYRPGRLIPDRPIQPRLPSGPPPNPGAERELDRKVMKLAMRREPDLPRSDLPKDRNGRGDEPPRLEKEQAAPDPKLPKGIPGVPGAKGTGPGRKLTLKDLGLSDAELGRAVGSRVNDYLKDVEDGDQTLLNTRRWRFATFFNRVKRQVAENWHPDVVYRRRDPAGNVYGFRDRLTILRVRLTPQGRLKDLHLEKACGVGFLDDEAISAFKAAEPFPNPPPGLIDKESGLISFRFGFLFEISNRPSFRLFRYNN
jgi:TonB family protein